jgi:hypothetical protein
MNIRTRCGLLALAFVVGATTAHAQIAAPRKPTDTRPAVTSPSPPASPPTPVRPAPMENRAGKVAPVTSDSQIRQQLGTQPIPSEGPATVTPPPATTAPPKVYDRDGRIVPGVKPAGPNRVFDSRTGKYHDVGPGGQIRP